MKFRITNKNYAAVMGKINTFFKKQVRIDLGIRDCLTGETKDVTDEKGNLLYTYFVREPRRVFEPYPGRCKIHHMYRELLDGKHRSNELLSIDAGPRLKITKPWGDRCIPVSIGDIVEFHGNRMILKEKRYESAGYDVTTFIQMDYDTKELAAVIKSGVLDSLNWLTDDTMWIDSVPEEFPSDVINVHRVSNDIRNSIDGFVESQDFVNGSGVHIITFKVSDITEDAPSWSGDVMFTFSIDMDKAIAGDYDDSIFKLSIDGNIINDTYPIISKIFREEEVQEELEDE